MTPEKFIEKMKETVKDWKEYGWKHFVMQKIDWQPNEKKKKKKKKVSIIPTPTAAARLWKRGGNAGNLRLNFPYKGNNPFRYQPTVNHHFNLGY